MFHFFYTILTVYGLAIYLSSNSNIYITISLIFLFLKVLQIELYDRDEGVFSGLKRDMSPYLFLGDLILMSFLVGSDLLTVGVVCFYLVSNVYIYVMYFANSSLSKRLKGRILPASDFALFSGGGNAIVSISYFPIYYYLLTTPTGPTKDGISSALTYAFPLFILFAFVGLGAYAKKRGILARQVDSSNFRYVVEVETVGDIDYFEEFLPVFSELRGELFVVVKNPDLGGIGGIARFAKMYGDSLDLPQGVGLVRLWLKDKTFVPRDGVLDVLLEPGDRLSGVDLKGLSGRYDRVLVGGDRLKERFIAGGFDPDSVIVAGKPNFSLDSSLEDCPRGVVFLPTELSSSSVIRGFSSFLSLNSEEIMEGGRSISIDLSLLGSNPDLDDAVSELISAVSEINHKIEGEEMEKRVSLVDLFSSELYAKYNGSKVRLETGGSTPLEKVRNYDVVLTDANPYVLGFLGRGKRCFVCGSYEDERVERELPGLVCVEGFEDLDLKMFETEIQGVPTSYVEGVDTSVMVECLRHMAR